MYTYTHENDDMNIPHPPAPSHAPPPPHTHQHPHTHSQDMNKRLASIFGKIADASTAQAGMEELYAFRCDHPDVLLEQHPSIASKSSQFQQFVLKGLQAIEQREAAQSPGGAGGHGGRAGGSASPPPQASTPRSGGGLLSLGGLQKRMAAFRMGGGN